MRKKLRLTNIHAINRIEDGFRYICAACSFTLRFLRKSVAEAASTENVEAEEASVTNAVNAGIRRALER